MPDIQHAWYSPKMAENYGTVTYKSADDPEKHVVATIVTKSEKHNCAWDDMEYIGMVRGWVRSDFKDLKFN